VAPRKKVQPKAFIPNPEQELVVSSREGFFKVLSGPGSGKSACLVNRYVRLVGSGVSPDDILSLTFTSSAAKSMRDRAEALVPVRKTDRVSGWMTFHSLALRFCEHERGLFPFKLAESVLLPEPLANKVASDAAKKYDLDFRTLRSYISLQKRNRVRPKDALKEAEKAGKGEKSALAYKMYDARLREIGQLDFDSMIQEMVELLSTPPRGKETPERFALTQRWQYQFVQSDESQDNDALQWALLRLMTQQHGNLLAVGDAGQNLYSFRGSSSEMFMDMGSVFSGCKTLYLAQNYRSTPEVTEFCKAVGPVPDLAEKFFSTNPHGPEPVITRFASNAQEAEAVAKLVSERDGATSAILARTNRGLRPLEDQLSLLGVPYHLLGKSGFWSQPEIRVCLGYLACTQFPSDGAVKAALAGSFLPSRYIRKTELKKALEKKPEDKSVMQFLARHPDEAVSKFVHFLDKIRKYRDHTPKDALTNLLSELKAYEYYKEEENADNSPVENLQEIQRLSARYSSIKEFLAYTIRASHASKGKKGVCLATIHAAKGGEWDSVYVVAVQDGILPHAKSESLAEEANCFFVAVSRAKTNLHISYAGQPSQFLAPFLKPEVDLTMEEVFA
jgi:DNA helicase-2/ATP-dependent DNA helicase PcrA